MIDTQRLLIRVAKEEDYNSSKNIWCDPKVRKYIGGDELSEEVFKKAFYEDLNTPKGDYGFKSVVLKSTNEHIGDSGLVEKEIEGKSEVEVVYFFASQFWGQGYATETARALINFAFEKLGLSRIVALIHPENLASEKVAIHIGMSFEKNVVTNSGNPRKLYVIAKN